MAGLSDNLRDDLISRLGVHEGDMMTPEAMQRVRSAAMAFDEHINIGTMYGKDNEVTLILSMPGARANAGGVIGGNHRLRAVGQRHVVGAQTECAGPHHHRRQCTAVEAGLAARPQYPALAKQARISGVVRLAAVIGKEGNVIDLKVISGHPLLIPAALEAVQQWVYQTDFAQWRTGGSRHQIDVNFTLSDEPIQQ